MYILESRDDPKTQKLLTNMSKHVPDGQFGDGSDRPLKDLRRPDVLQLPRPLHQEQEAGKPEEEGGRKKNEAKSLKEQKPLSTAIVPSKPSCIPIPIMNKRKIPKIYQKYHISGKWYFRMVFGFFSSLVCRIELNLFPLNLHFSPDRF